MLEYGNLKIFNENVQFDGNTKFTQLIETQVDKLDLANTTPVVTNITRFLALNTGPITVTNFLHGQSGQEIKILGDGYTTIAHNSSIATNTGANKLLAANKVYTFTLFANKWYENE